MPLESADKLARGHVPQLHRAVLATREHREPSGENATVLSVYWTAASKVRTSWPVAASHNFIVLWKFFPRSRSRCPESTRAPSGENATERTSPEYQSTVRMSRPVAASHNFIV